MDDTLFIFIDESGNLDFTKNGSKYYLFPAVTTTKPLDNRVLLHELRYKIVKYPIFQAVCLTLAN